MALVTSATDITVIILDNKEANALANLLEVSPIWRHQSVLNELTAAMLVEKMAFAYDGVDDD